MSGWYLQQVGIEGFRGINNEGAPLTLKFKPDSVNSVSAPNGVGKSSIFDAVLYSITGRIVKLDELPAAEKGANYYLNRFHNGGVGTIALTLMPAAGGPPVTVTVMRQADGSRAVAASDGHDGEAILTELDQEFVLLDGKSFREFIDFKPLDRGRSFAGLLGLRRYSQARQALLGAANTRAFNNQVGINAIKLARDTATTSENRARANIAEAYLALVGEAYDPAMAEEEALAKAHAALGGIELLKPHCEGRQFEEIDPAACVDAAKAAEGGEDREKLSGLIRTETQWSEAAAAIPGEDSRAQLVAMADARDAALAKTKGDAFRELYTAGEQILARDEWEDKSVCPTCDTKTDGSVLDHVRQKIGDYNSVSAAAIDLSTAWGLGGWSGLKSIEALAAEGGEAKIADALEKRGADGLLNGEEARGLVAWATTLLERAGKKIGDLGADKLALEKALPPKLTAVVEKAEAARRLQSNLKDLREARTTKADRNQMLARLERVKTFLDAASDGFAAAESAAATRRLAAIEPKCREYFSAIMFQDVVPALTKRAGTEELFLSLSSFWTLEKVSAQALLSESFRNAFAISVYLAAASLYAGGAKFLILDDVTSSFDCGHQFHLMNVIRDKFARPGVADGPQVILLSHDPVLEKLFNTNSNAGGWWHQCIQGTPRTAVLPQSGAVSRIKDATLAHLHAGNVEDAAPRIRQYLEFKLEEVITKVGVPVPMTIAFSDDKHMAKNLIDAIKAAVDLHEAAGKLALEPAQRAGLNTAVARIVGNYTSHWATGQTHFFTAGALLGVMTAIDDFARCFQREHPAGAGQFVYYKSLAQQ